MAKQSHRHLPREISFRADRPLAPEEDPSGTFCDPLQAKATTATIFFRNPEMFAVLRKALAPAWMEAHPHTPLTAWSAGCSSGQEAYSLAMVASHAYAANKKFVNVRVFGTDINHDCIAEARRGVYAARMRDERFRPLLKRYTAEREGIVTLKPELRSLVTFGVFDLRKTPRNHTFAYIVCNHVLQYYTEPVQRQILQNFLSVLEPEGVLYMEGLTYAQADQMELRRLPGTRNAYYPPEKR